jgi:mannose/cellobiose epimerase-like protein (N-acyl-D-glucosamine 2-epimerase family)
MERQQDTDHGGFIWVLNGHNVEDGEKWCYSMAFGLLALANAFKAQYIKGQFYNLPP